MHHGRARHLPNRTKKLECPLCSKTFYSKSGVNALLNSHHTNETTHRCDKCSYATHYSSNLIRHIREKHVKGESTQRMFKCEVCGYRANQRSAISNHWVNTHTEEIKFQCDASGCAYKTNYSTVTCKCIDWSMRLTYSHSFRFPVVFQLFTFKGDPRGKLMNISSVMKHATLS